MSPQSSKDWDQVTRDPYDHSTRDRHEDPHLQRARLALVEARPYELEIWHFWPRGENPRWRISIGEPQIFWSYQVSIIKRSVKFQTVERKDI